MDPILHIRHDTNRDLDTLIVIGTSTGGPQALTTVFSSLQVIPGTACLIVQHMPPGFTANLAKRLDQLSTWQVKEAEDGEPICSGLAYMAPGGFQLRIDNKMNTYSLRIRSDGQVNGHQPSVDALFFSVADIWKGSLIGVIMTGMGRDGANGLKEIRNRGGYTIAEAEDSCVVFGMPKAAVSIDAAVVVAPLPDIASAVCNGWNSVVRAGH